MKFKNLVAIIISALIVFSLVGCNSDQSSSSGSASSEQVAQSTTDDKAHATKDESTDATTHATQTNENDSANIDISASENSLLDPTNMFSDRDLEQQADLTGAVYIDLESDTTIALNEEGVYVFKGDVTNTTIVVEAEDEINYFIEMYEGICHAMYIAYDRKSYYVTENSERFYCFTQFPSTYT